MLQVEIDGKKYPFLVDSGATKSSLSGKFYNGPVSSVCINTMGINGTVVQCPKTHSLKTRWGSKPDEITYHPFVIIPNSPVNLLGRDLMAKMNLCISFNTKDLTYPIHCTISALTLPAEYQNMTLWSKGENDVGFIDCIPYHAQLKNNTPVYVKQYPISVEKASALDVIIGDLLTTGVIKPTVSPYNTPVNPVPKPNKPGVWRFTQDLRQINAVIIPLPPLVPDVPSILTCIPSTATHFTVVDLCSAFFSVPVHVDTQPLFAFTHRNKQYTWTRLPQGMIDSPAAFSMVIRATLDSFTPPEGCTLIQYVDDLLLCAPSEELCQTATHMLLQHLQKTGHKASAKKMQYCQTSVQYLGFTLSHGKRSMTADRVKALHHSSHLHRKYYLCPYSCHLLHSQTIWKQMLI
uniref:ribonuclease H n=1 Tax=Astatotilapia calliptera TaxID=8154 RepID=A0AAX7ULX2_ASTCA